MDRSSPHLSSRKLEKEVCLDQTFEHYGKSHGGNLGSRRSLVGRRQHHSKRVAELYWSSDHRVAKRSFAKQVAKNAPKKRPNWRMR
jgi:hypothetical protein